MRQADVRALAAATHAEDRLVRGLPAVGFGDLTEQQQEANLDSARFAPLLLTALGLQIREGTHPGSRTALTAEELDAGSRLEHLRWCRFTRRIGRTEHPDLVPWDELDEATRELDRLRVRALPRLLAELGYSVVDAPP